MLVDFFLSMSEVSPQTGRSKKYFSLPLQPGYRLKVQSLLLVPFPCRFPNGITNTYYFFFPVNFNLPHCDTVLTVCCACVALLTFSTAWLGVMDAECQHIWVMTVVCLWLEVKWCGFFYGQGQYLEMSASHGQYSKMIISNWFGRCVSLIWNQKYAN